MHRKHTQLKNINIIVKVLDDDCSLSYGTSSGVYNQSTGPISTNAYTVSGLANGTIYFFKVFASNSLGSYESEELSIEVGSLLPSLGSRTVASLRSGPSFGSLGRGGRFLGRGWELATVAP